MTGVIGLDRYPSVSQLMNIHYAPHGIAFANSSNELFTTISDGFLRKNNKIRVTFFLRKILAEIFSAAKFQQKFGG